LKHCNVFISIPSHISKLSKLSITACNKNPIPVCDIIAFSWVYRRNSISILVVGCFVNRYPGCILWLCLFTFLPIFSSDFQHFRPQHHWKDFISRNACLVLQSWYCISLSFIWYLGFSNKTLQFGFRYIQMFV
jgi:hypothetical protein